MGPIGLPEMMALFVIALLLFGPKKLPELGRTLGKGLTEFRRAKNELKATLESHMNEIERETRIESPSSSDSSNYTYPYEDYNQYGSDYHAPDRQLTSEQQAVVEENAAQADPAAHGVPAAEHSPVEGTVPRTNGVQPVHVAQEEKHAEATPEVAEERRS